jgi:hypothetical protein
MPDAPRHLIERRIWRICFLLTGNELAAADLVDRVLRAHDVRGMEPAKLDRLIVQQAREMLGTGYSPGRKRPRTLPLSPLAARAEAPIAETLKLVQVLPEQPREAWVLTRIDDLDELHVSRAMDCSKTAMHNHLHAADEQLRGALNDRYDAALAALRRFADTLDPGPVIAQRRAQRRIRQSRRVGFIAVLIVTVLLIVLMAWLKGWW